MACSSLSTKRLVDVRKKITLNHFLVPSKRKIAKFYEMSFFYFTFAQNK